MKYRSLILLLAILFIFTACGTDSDNQEIDKNDVEQSGENANVEETTPEEVEPTYNIVSTTVALVEIMDKLEIDLAAVPTSYKDLPARYDGLPEIGNGMDPDLEMIMSLQPTEIMSVSTLKADLDEKMSTLNTETVYYNLESLGNMLDEIQHIGEKYNRVDLATALIEKYETKQAEIAELTADKEGPSVLILLGVPGSYLIATEQSYIGDLVAKSGGVNVFSDEDVEYISVNTEFLQQKNPDVILRAAHGLPDQVVEMFDEEFKTNDIWQHFDAVKNERVFDLEETLFGTTANLAAIEAFDELLPMLYPEMK